MSKEQYGRTRRVVGAHYGTVGFIVQRVTAIILAVYSVLFLLAALFTPITYENWVHFFTFTCFGVPVGRMLVTVAFFSLAWHAWIGVRDIWMDYIKPFGLRLALFALTLLWLAGCVAYFAAIVWRL
ncbi:succinate dehydrogenase, hydrophobic membrane anchor protein [Pelistega europaea]|uniref:Succinate dehydrogenase hydrophobic membrane anchor subunit n=1 Tax=Pelistega europaea TaxID=106147 RepID=A0A7Y4L9D2_9BURK|nr:succinate dehydrogenase, hydrophobic membrane anchor protein [Pelistega europaea]NOL49414.1 succinate dehydrogenase, hydrophobic membrane anchor protein [Pelistega europaea]